MRRKLTDTEQREWKMQRTPRRGIISPEEHAHLRALEDMVPVRMSHRSAMKEFDRIKREAWQEGPRGSSWEGKWS